MLLNQQYPSLFLFILLQKPIVHNPILLASLIQNLQHLLILLRVPFLAEVVDFHIQVSTIDRLDLAC